MNSVADAPASSEAARGGHQAPALAPGALSREEFNRLAAEQALPLFWIADANHNRTPDPDEIAVLWGVDATARADWVAGDRFTDRFRAAVRQLVSPDAAGQAAARLPAAERTRLELVRQELSQGLPTLVLTDLRQAPAEDRAVAQRILAAAAVIERIYAKQCGVDRFLASIPADDRPSRALFVRNQGPWCVAPKTENDARCNALASRPKRLSGLYPAALQTPGFCQRLGRRSDGEMLLHQFVVVRAAGETLRPVPYHVAYAAEMRQVSDQLRAAAAELRSAHQQAFKAYLLAAAQAFVDDSWQQADEAWSQMSVHNSRWYLRIGPDEVYFEPCSRKAGFHVSFARINRDSLQWQSKLEPLKGEMEQVIARLAGAPYTARKVSFQMPDFVDVVVNAGDSRSPMGATIGQSLPNWGPVANEGRGRTVAMTNLYTDPDSRSQLREQASSLLCAATMKAHYTDDTEPQLMSTVLHEAAHNLGPSHEYRVRGKKASQIFGGPLASTLEELKAQTAALFFTGWLASKGVIDRQRANHAWLRDMVWAFGHIARGMYTASDEPKPYSQLAAIQLGVLGRGGAMRWRADELAANGKDRGCFAVDLPRFGPAVEQLMRRVSRIKARGDRRDAEALKRDFVDAAGEHQRLLSTIRERWLRHPKASFVYSVRL